MYMYNNMYMCANSSERRVGGLRERGSPEAEAAWGDLPCLRVHGIGAYME